MIDKELSSIFKSCADEIRSKGVNGTFTPYQLSSGIHQIQTDNKPVQDEWCLPRGWFDLRQIYKNDIAQSVGKVAYLIRVNEDGTVPTYGYSSPVQLSNYGFFSFINDTYNIISARTSNEPDRLIKLTSQDRSIFKVDWDESKYIPNPYNNEKYVWIEGYYNVSSIQCTYLGTNKSGTVWVCGDETLSNDIHGEGRFARDLVAITGFRSLKVGTYAFEVSQLETIPPLNCPNNTAMTTNFSTTKLKKINWLEGGKPLSCTSYNYTFSYIYGLREFPDVLFKNNRLTSVYCIASNVHTIEKYPDVMDFSKITYNPHHFWNHCNYLRQYIRHLPETEFDFPSLSSNNLTCTFNQMGLLSPQTIARFDSNDNLSGGWFYAWNKHPSDNHISVRFAAKILGTGIYDQNKMNSISSYLENKGITIINAW